MKLLSVLFAVGLVSAYSRNMRASPFVATLTEAAVNTASECAYATAPDDFAMNAERGSIFNSLSEDEIKSVTKWMLVNSSLNLVPFTDADQYHDNYITHVYLAEPLKGEALGYLHDGNGRPQRRAQVHVSLGAMEVPIIRVYTVGPLPISDETMLSAPVSYGGVSDIPFNARPTDSKEYAHLDRLILKVMGEIESEMRDSYGTSYYSECPDQFCLTYSDTSPRGPDRDLTIWFLFDVEAFFANPIGFYLVFNVGSIQKSHHYLKLIVYNGQSFESIAEFKAAYASDQLIKLSNRPLNQVLIQNSAGVDWASLIKSPSETGVNKGRGKETRLNSDIPAPDVQEPGGKRYKLENNHVDYLGWSFNINHNPISGLKLFNIRYRGESVAYEIGISEALAVYSGINDLVQAATVYGDSSWGLGASVNEQVRGIDCPATGQFVDVSFLYDSGRPSTVKNAICVFEHSGQTPLRRHSNGASYGGLPTNSLVVRIILPIYNYDYIFDHVFHINGALEIRGSMSGYLQSTFYSPELDNEIKFFGQRIGHFSAGTTHDHVLNFKLDLDVGGTANKLVKASMTAVKATPADLNGKPFKLSNLEVADDYMTKLTTHSVVKKERGFTLIPTEPTVFSVISNHSKNRWGAPKGYKLKLNGVIHNLVAHTKSCAAYSFSKHTLAATVRHEDEPTVASIYDQSDTTGTIFQHFHDGRPRPLVDLDRYLADEEALVDEDLVLWVNVGVHHHTQAEDIPVTNTNGNTVQIFLLPHNAFAYDDSMNVANSAYAPDAGTITTFDLKTENTCEMTYTPLGTGYHEE